MYDLLCLTCEEAFNTLQRELFPMKWDNGTAYFEYHGVFIYRNVYWGTVTYHYDFSQL